MDRDVIRNRNVELITVALSTKTWAKSKDCLAG